MLGVHQENAIEELKGVGLGVPQRANPSSSIMTQKRLKFRASPEGDGTKPISQADAGANPYSSIMTQKRLEFRAFSEGDRRKPINQADAGANPSSSIMTQKRLEFRSFSEGDGTKPISRTDKSRLWQIKRGCLRRADKRHGLKVGQLVVHSVWRELGAGRSGRPRTEVFEVGGSSSRSSQGAREAGFSRIDSEPSGDPRVKYRDFRANVAPTSISAVRPRRRQRRRRIRG